MYRKQNIRYPVVPSNTWSTHPHQGTTQADTSGQLVTFYRNGDPHFKGLQTSVSRKLFATLETLKSWLAEKLAVSVNHVFALPGGQRVRNLEEFVGGHSYVASSSKRIKRMMYGDSKEQFWRNKPASANAALNRTFLFDSDVSPKSKRKTRESPPHSLPTTTVSSLDGRPVDNLTYVRYGLAKPRMLVIRSNTHRGSQQKVLFNPRTVQLFEDFLHDMTRALQLQYPPVTALFTAQPPFRKVTGISHLIKGLRKHGEFLACGRELFPLELAPEPPTDLPTSQREYRVLPRKPALRQPPEHEDSVDGASEASALRDDLRSPVRVNYQRPGGDPWKTKQRPIAHPPVVLSTLAEFERPDTYPPVVSPVRRVIPYNLPHNDDINGSMQTSNGTTAPGRDSVQMQINGKFKEFFAPGHLNGDGDRTRPDRNLRLDWVYGYGGRGTAGSIHVLPSGELVYYAAGIGVVYNKKTNSQRHYLGHDNDISCIAMNPDERNPFIATAQVKGQNPESKSLIRIWNPYSLGTVTAFEAGGLQTSFISVSFSHESISEEVGRYLMAVDDSHHHVLYVWEWRNRVLLAKTATSSNVVIGGAFHPSDHSTIITFGDYHIYFWKFSVPYEEYEKRDNEGRIVRDKQSGMFKADHPIPKSVTSLTFASNGDVISGTSDGVIFVWSRNPTSSVFDLSSNFSAHKGCARMSLHMLPDGTLLSASGSELKSWNSSIDYSLIQTKIIPERTGFIGTIRPRCRDAKDGVVFLGTTQNNILQENLNDSTYSYYVQGHIGEMCAIAIHPVDQGLFVSAARDSNVSQWHSIRHRINWRVHVETPCLSVAYNTTGNHVVVGTMAGRFVVLTSKAGDHVTSVQAGSEPLEAIKFSPDGRYLAVGSHDRSIYVFAVLDENNSYQRYQSGALQGHVGKVTNIDWSKDGKWLQSTTTEPDLKFWDVKNMREKKASLMRDVDWSTQTCVLGYEVLGAWSNLRQDETITSTVRSNGRNLLAVGTSAGILGLYRFPCTAERPDVHHQKLWSGRVTRVCFTNDDRYVIAAAGVDGVITQWQTTNNSRQEPRHS